MQLSILALFTASLAAFQAAAAAVPSQASAEVLATLEKRTVTCYTSGGYWGDQSQKDEANRLANDWCRVNAGRNYASGQQFKSCVSYSGGYIMFRMKNGAGSTAYLDQDSCFRLLAGIVLGCAQGGADDNSPTWRPRSDPGTGCD